MNANTVSFQNKLAKKRSCDGFWEIRGYDSTGNVVMVIIISIICHNSIDYDCSVQLDEPENNTASKAWTEAMLSKKADIEKVYTKEEINARIGTIETELAEI